MTLNAKRRVVITLALLFLTSLLVVAALENL